MIDDAGAALIGFRWGEEEDLWIEREMEKEMRVRRRKGRKNDLLWIEKVEKEGKEGMEGKERLKIWCERKLGDCSIDMSGLCQFIYVVG